MKCINFEPMFIKVTIYAPLCQVSQIRKHNLYKYIQACIVNPDILALKYRRLQKNKNLIKQYPVNVHLIKGTSH